MQGFEVEDQVQLTDVLEQLVEGLHVDLDQIDKGKRRLGRCRDDDEIKGRIVAVCYQCWNIVLFFRGGVGGA